MEDRQKDGVARPGRGAGPGARRMGALALALCVPQAAEIGANCVPVQAWSAALRPLDWALLLLSVVSLVAWVGSLALGLAAWRTAAGRCALALSAGTLAYWAWAFCTADI